MQARRPTRGGRAQSVSRYDQVRFVLWLYAANTLLLSLVSIRYFGGAPPPDDLLGSLFRTLIIPGQFVLLCLPLALVVLPVAVVVRRAAFRTIAVVVFGVAWVVVLLDIEVFTLYRFHLNSMVWNLLTSGVAGEILPLSGRTATRAALVVVAAFLGETALAFAVGRAMTHRLTPSGWRVAGAALAVVIAGQALHVWADAFLVRSITREMRYLPWLDGITAKGVLDRLGVPRPEPDRALGVSSRAHSGLRYPLGPLGCVPKAIPLNILVVAIEEWRFDALDPATTPKMWDFAQAGSRFRRHFTSGNSSRYGIFGLIYGLHPSYWDAMLAEQRGPVLIETLRNQGYAFFVRGSASLAHPEFDRTVFVELRGDFPTRTPGRRARDRDEKITEDFLAFLDAKTPDPFFAFLFYDSPHSLDYPETMQAPYHPVWEEVDYLALDSDFDPAPYLNRHRNSVHYVDKLVGRALAGLRSRRELDRTIVIVTGDHGEEFNESRKNYWGHNSNFSRYQTQVPLVVWWPGVAAATHDRLTSHLDVAPTLMRRALGCEAAPEQFSSGLDLFSPSPREHVAVGGGSVGTAAISVDTITLVERYGGLRVLDHDWHDLPSARPDTDALIDVMRETGRFFAR